MRYHFKQILSQALQGKYTGNEFKNASMHKKLVKCILVIIDKEAV
jgi:hypothetical protein